MNLSRSSPFGPLTQASSRRTFAYLIATLNASHEDYDFSHILRPDDFRREKSLKAVMHNIDSTLMNLRTADEQNQTVYGSCTSTTETEQVWGPQMWALIDKEMELKECSIYCFDPVDLDEEEQALWSINYFFYNKAKKRVAYLYVRGVAGITHSPSGAAKRAAAIGDGSSKRAKYWLGDRAGAITGENSENSDYDIMEEDNGYAYKFDDEYDDEADDEYEDRDRDQERRRSIRGVSEDIASRMDLD